MSSPNNAMDPKTRNWHVLELCKRKLLTGDPTKYIEVSHKFAKWASDPRAYYDEVKPIIIDLLELTLKTLKSILGLEPNAHFNVHNFTENEYVKSWKRLIDVVYNFKDKFPHKDDTRLHARLNSLHLTASNPQDTIDVDATAPIVHASASPQIKACSSTPPIVHSSLSPTSKAPSLSPMTASSATLSVLSPEQITSAISAASPNAPPEQITSPIPPPLASSSSFIPEMVPTEEIHIADSSDSAPTKPRKKKKRRIAPVQDLVALDFAGRAAVSSDSTDVSTQPMDVQRSQETQVTLGDEVMMPMPPPASVAPSAISSASAPATEDVFRAGSERAASASEEILPSVPLASSIEEPTRSASAAPVQHHDIDADGRTQQEAVVPSSSIQGDSMQRAQSASSAMKLSKSPTPNFLDEAHMAGSPLVTLAHLTAFPPPASRSPSATLAEKPNTHAAASSMDMEPGEVTPSAAVISSPEDGQVPNLGMEDAMQVDSGKVEDTVDDDVEMVEGTSTVPAQNDQEIFASSAQLPQARPAPQIRQDLSSKICWIGRTSLNREASWWYWHL
ncbi:hypothetical protein BT96DRAFT_174216 [Gymnopus androsaceus JB14]|uniref:Uncharacterized protein n=1 Tax=Gymnopus androsaceus JB14 TaxID=1447944 RepID=A0A6A4IAJ0_9AGAR|nr:hypothetical protein BT96DRAFT_174216 [Gymnopus androsaceus JB14]